MIIYSSIQPKSIITLCGIFYIDYTTILHRIVLGRLYFLFSSINIFSNCSKIHSRVSASDKEQPVKQFWTLFRLKTNWKGFKACYHYHMFGFESEQCLKLFYSLCLVWNTHSWMNLPQFQKNFGHCSDSKPEFLGGDSKPVTIITYLHSKLIMSSLIQPNNPYVP